MRPANKGGTARYCSRPFVPFVGEGILILGAISFQQHVDRIGFDETLIAALMADS
jgi:hypothetical protein